VYTKFRWRYFIGYLSSEARDYFAFMAKTAVRGAIFINFHMSICANW